MRFSKKCYLDFGHVPIGVGAVFHGWGITEEEFRNPNRLPVVDFRAMKPICPHDCFHCFTKRSPHTLTLEKIKSVIAEIAAMGAIAINFLGEGEPTIDPDFFSIIEYTLSLGVIPVVFTDGATMMRNPEFVRRVKAAGASVILKCDSIFSPQYQNRVVGDKTGTYFNQREEALAVLIDEGLNDIASNGTTRLGFDMVVSAQNIDEVPATLRFCRERNIWVIFAFYLPAGKSADPDFDESLRPSNEQIQQMREEVSRIDSKFGFNHTVRNNFATHPCVERMQIWGDGRVTPCPGNETVFGHVQDSSVAELNRLLLEGFPQHHPADFHGNCLYRPACA